MDSWITDTPLSDRFPFYTRANAGEVLPHPVSPLAWTLTWDGASLAGWRDAQINVGTCEPAELPEDQMIVVGCFGGHLYINASLARLFGHRAPGMSAEMIDFVYFGTHPDVPPFQPTADDENPAATARLGEWMTEVMMATDLPELLDERIFAEEVRLSRPELTELSDVELVARAREFRPALQALFERHLTVTAGASIGPGVVQAVSDALGDPGLAMRALAGIGDVDSAAPSWAMWALSRLIRESSTLQALFDGGIEDLEDRLYVSEHPDARAFGWAIDDFLVRYGSRGPNEWDIRSDTWETKPSLVLAAIDRMRFADDADSPEARHVARVADREAVSAQMRSAISADPATLAQFSAAEQSAKVYLAGRERAKTNIIKVLHEVRMVVWELGERAVALEVCTSPSDITMLLDSELDAFLADPKSFTTVISDRLAAMSELAQLDPPFIINGEVPPLRHWPRKNSVPMEAAETGIVLRGVAGCPGIARGRACVVLDPSDPLVLEPGDILVAPLTDPAWTPLFVPAAAVVVDVGAQVSHAVIVSRELGLPCVVSVKDATKRIPNGAMIEVDGTNGTVTIL